MTALRVQDTETPVSPTSTPAPPRAPRRAGTARRQTTAAGQARRSLQRDLARREASLRINRRASGPAGGLQRPAAPTPPQAQPPISPQVPVARPAAAMPAMPVQPQPSQRAARPVAPAPRPAVRRAPAPAPQPVAARPGADLRPPQARAPYGVAPATAAAVATAESQARPAQVAAPARPFIVLPGGAPDAAPGTRRRLSTPAVIISALVAVVLTIGMIVAAQIRVTQMNEQIGSDLAANSQLTQSTTALKERISALATTARIDDEAQRRQLIEPDPVDVRYLSTGDRAQTAERAARVLRQQPLNPAGGPRATTSSAAPTTTSTTPTATSTAPTATSTAPAAAPTTTTTTGTTTP